MSIKYFLLLLIMLTFIGCQPRDHQGPSEQEKIENAIIAQTAKQLKIEKKLSPAGFGGSDIEGQEFLEISFQYFQPLNIEQAREFVIYSAQVFLNNLSNDKRLQSLIKKPYTMGNIQIVVYIYNPDYSKLEPPNVGLVELIRNKIIYSYGNFEKVHEETYEEALEKLKDKEK